MNSKKLEESIVKIQRRYKTIKSEINSLNYSVSFQRDYLISMINNLSSLNTIKLFQETDSLYVQLLKELKNVKTEIDKYPEIISFKSVVSNSTSSGTPNYMKHNNEITKLLIKISNHISSDNMNYVFKLLINENWVDNFSKDDLEKLLFITRFIKPISIWDSDMHSTEVPLNNMSTNTPVLGPMKSQALTKDIIESLLGIIPKNTDDKGLPKNITSIIINPMETNGPTILKTINDLIDMNPKKTVSKRNNHFIKSECMTILGDENIKITKNIKSSTLIEDKNGVCIFIKWPIGDKTMQSSKILAIQGLFKDDILNISNGIKFVKDRLNILKGSLSYDVLTVPKYFKDNYLKILNLRDLVVSSSNEIAEDVKKKYNDYRSLQAKPLLSLINEFLLASKYRKIDILTLLLMSNQDDQKLAFILFDVFKSKDKKDATSEVYQSLHHIIRELLDVSKAAVEKDEQELSKISDSDIPYERRINMMKANDNVKAKAMEKLKAMKSSFQGDSKAQAWLDGLLKLPFGIDSVNEIISFKENFISKLNQSGNVATKLFSDNQVDSYIEILRNNLRNNLQNNEQNDSHTSIIEEWTQYKANKKEYLREVRKTLDSAVYGHKEAKVQLERIFAQWINGESKGAVLGLMGPPGTGKTSLAKNGLSKCLKDKNGKPRPFAFLPIGGSVNGSTLVGHNFTYVGSTWGRIADVLMSSECMNPIIFIDEIDKVSHTEHGKEIISILTHLTDSTQNDEFEDKFFAGIKLDLSKALIVFSFNDPDLIDPILKDRITVIETHPLSTKEKVTIIQDYMFPEICKDVGFNKDEVILSEELIRFLIDTYTNEAGVRKIKEKIVEIVRDINLNRFHDDTKYTIPFTITKEYIVELFENKPKVRVKKVHDEPTVGTVNGLYATSSGIGGITPIQAVRFPSDKMLELMLTGKAGDVMKESVQYSLKVAWSLLTTEEQNKIMEDSQNKKAFGIHIHCPDGATPKDGPSAGLAFTLAIYSLLTNKKVNNKVCMTGEVDLYGKAGIIGGLESKLNGGKNAGCTLALVPEDNMEDVIRFRREGLSPEDDTFKVIAVSTIHDIIKHAIVTE